MLTIILNNNINYFQLKAGITKINMLFLLMILNVEFHNFPFHRMHFFILSRVHRT